MAADRADELSALADQDVTGPEDHSGRLLGFALHSHEAHGRALRPLAERSASGVRDAIEGAGASLLFYLPPYSRIQPIENAFAKLKALLRAKAERTINALWDAVGAVGLKVVANSAGICQAIWECGRAVL